MSDYSKTGRPIHGNRGLSKFIREEFALIETAINSKADLSSPNFTDLPTAPTAPLGTSTDQLATMKALANQALNTAIPVSPADDQKFLTNNGAISLWEVIHQHIIHRTPVNAFYTVSIDDRGNLIDWSGSSNGIFSFDPVATLGDGWFCYIYNAGTADISLNPFDSEQIDGLITYKMYPGEARLIQCDGSSLTSIVLSSFNKTFTSSQTFTPPPGYRAFSALLWSGGGGGGRSLGDGGGGGGGGCIPITAPASLFGPIEVVTIGSGGIGRTGSAGTGGTGGTSTFLGVSVTGGLGGTASAGGNGGGVVGSSVSASGSGFEGRIAGNGSSVYGGAGGGVDAGGDSVYGGAGGAGINVGVPKLGGVSSLGGNGGNASISATAGSGTAPGGGGGGGKDNDGGDGARGELQIWGLA